MIPPIRCFTCGKVVADKYDYYIAEKQKMEKKEEEQTAAAKKKKAVAGGGVAGIDENLPGLRHFDGIYTKQILDKLGLTRYCCRRMMLGTEDMMDKI